MYQHELTKQNNCVISKPKIIYIYFFFIVFIQPICLPIKPKHRNNMLVSSVPFVAGWGSTSFRE